MPLILQGRITKVLNMKPPEILGMLEEAAGTRMYENKKENALRTLKKKDLKVEEINNILDNDILPALERLRGERAQYLEWMANKSNVERLQRVCVAHDFWKADTLAESSAESHVMRQKKHILSLFEICQRGREKEKGGY